MALAAAADAEEGAAARAAPRREEGRGLRRLLPRARGGDRRDRRRGRARAARARGAGRGARRARGRGRSCSARGSTPTPARSPAVPRLSTEVATPPAHAVAAVVAERLAGGRVRRAGALRARAALRSRERGGAQVPEGARARRRREVRSDMNVFVTGATGLIGRAVCAALLGRGHIVTALSRSPDAHRSPPRPAPASSPATPPRPGRGRTSSRAPTRA